LAAACESCLPSIDQAKKEGVRTARQHRLLELFHVAQAGGPLDQRADRRAVALDLGLDGDDVARVEAEGLHHIDAVGRVVKGDRGGRKHAAGGRGLRARDRDLVERLIQLRGERRLVGEERERQSEACAAACGCTRSSGLPAESKYFFRIQCLTCAPRLVKRS
jgi:hypothetical protein